MAETRPALVPESPTGVGTGISAVLRWAAVPGTPYCQKVEIEAPVGKCLSVRVLTELIGGGYVILCIPMPQSLVVEPVPAIAVVPTPQPASAPVIAETQAPVITQAIVASVNPTAVSLAPTVATTSAPVVAATQTPVAQSAVVASINPTVYHHVTPGAAPPAPTILADPAAVSVCLPLQMPPVGWESGGVWRVALKVCVRHLVLSNRSCTFTNQQLIRFYLPWILDEVHKAGLPGPEKPDRSLSRELQLLRDKDQIIVFDAHQRGVYHLTQKGYMELFKSC